MSWNLSAGCHVLVRLGPKDADMNLVETFHKHAADCEQMAKLTHDAESKAAWRELADRFRVVAEKTAPPLSHAATRRQRHVGRLAGQPIRASH
jgi:hypothetical protein